MRAIVIFFFFFILATVTYGQVVSSGGGTGDWNDPNSWTPTGVPSSASGTITIQPFHTITVSDAQSADELLVDGDGALIIANGGELTIVDGSGDDLTVVAADFIFTFSDGSLTIQNGGELINQGQISTPQLTFTIEDGGTFTHNQNSGTIPTVTWNSGSIIEIQGVTTTLPSGLNQTFHHFNYNCSGQTAGALFFNNLSIVNGNLNIVSSNARFIGLSTSAGSMTVGGNVTISNTSKLYLSPTANYTLNVGGDMTVDSNQAGFALLFTANATGTINVDGNFVKSNSGTINFAAASGSGVLNVGGNVTISAGSLTESSTGLGTINFTGSTVQTFSNSGTISNTINFNVASNAIVDFGTSTINGTGTFTTNNLSEIRVGSTAANGPVQTSGAGGNIRLTGTQTFNSGSSIVFNGVAAQFVGSLYPSNVNTTINNSNGVTLASDVTFGGSLTLTSGNLTVGSNQLTLAGTLSATGSISVTSASDIVINGSGAFGSFPFLAASPTLNDFTFDRSGETVVFDENVTINGALALTQGDLNFAGRTLNLIGTISGGGNLISDGTSTLNITGSGSFGTFQFGGTNTIGTLTFNRTTSGAATLQGTLNIETALTLTNGIFTNNASLFMGDGSNLTKNSNASLTGNSPETSGGALYNVIYTNAGQTTGSEIPSAVITDALGNLTIQTSGAVVLDQDLQVNGNVTLQTGSLSIGSNEISVAGNWVRNSGSMASYTGLVIFNGITTISGSSAATFGNVSVTNVASLTMPSGITNFTNDLQIDAGATFNDNSGTAVLNGSGAQNLGTGGATFNNITVNKTGGAVTLTSALNLVGALTIQTATTFNSNGNLAIISSSDGTSGNGQITTLPAGASVSGNVTVQRFMSGEGRIWRYLSSPVSNATVADWQDDFPITGTFSDPSTGTGIVSANPSMYYFNESAGGTFNDRYVAYPSSGTAASNSLVPGRGYSAFIREAATSTTVTVTGPINQGSVNFNVTYTPTSDPSDGYNLVGNPYPSSIDWDNPGWTKTNVGGTVAVRDNPSGIFQYWNGSVGGLSQGLIATGQAFWIVTTAGSPSLIATEGVKTSAGTTGTFYKPNEIENLMVVSLSDGSKTDKTYLAIYPGSTPGYDTQFDALKLNNDIFDLSTLDSEGNKLAINFFSEFGCDKSLAIDISNAPEDNYTLNFDGLVTFNGDYEIKLIDNFLSAETILTEGLTYNFDITSDAASLGSDRFEIIFSRDIINSDLSIESNSSACNDELSTVTIESSQSGVTYSLFVNEMQVGDNLIGDGNQLAFEIPYDNLTIGLNEAKIMGNFAGCSSKLIGDIIEISKTYINTELNFSLSNTLCNDENAEITLINSQNGINYQLLLDGVIIGNPQTGTGNNLIFEILSNDLSKVNNEITIEASAEGCNEILTQIEIIDKINIDPELAIELNSNLCGQENVNATIVNAENAVSYQLLINEEPFGTALDGTGADLNFEIPGTDVNDSDVLSFVGSLEGCVTTLSQTSIINKDIVDSGLTFDLSNSICQGDNSIVTLQSPQNGVNYQIVVNGEIYSNSQIGAGDDLVFEVLSEDLNDMDNQITLRAFTDICDLSLDQIESVSKIIIEPTITQVEDQLISNYSDGNKWYLNGVLISDATSNIITPLESGLYTLEVEKNECSESVSFEYILEQVTSLKKVDVNEIKLYPNPVKNVLQIHSNNEFIEAMEIIDSRGNSIDYMEINAQDFQYNTQHLSKGIYFIRLRSQNNVSLQRFIKE